MGASEQRVMIVGGGIGGLSAALALQRAGVPVRLFERAPELGEVGTGVQVWINGMVAMRELGLVEAVASAGAPIETQEFRSWRGPSLTQLQVATLARRNGAPTGVVIRRPDLLRALTDALDMSDVELDAGCASFEQDADGVTVRLADGREERGAILVGADGLRSTVRAMLVPEAQPRYAGYQYLRALTQGGGEEVPTNHVSISFGRGDRFGLCDAGGGWRYFFAVIVTPQGTTDSAAGRKADLLERFGGFHAPIPRVIEETPQDMILRHDILDLEPLPRWTDGRVTLLGDAAHATTPNLGRGAGEALEDGAALASALAGVGDLGRADDVRAALATYESRRREASAAIQRSAWQIGKLSGWRNPVMCAVREQVMRRITGKVLAKGIDREFGLNHQPGGNGTHDRR